MKPAIRRWALLLLAPAMTGGQGGDSAAAAAAPTCPIPETCTAASATCGVYEVPLCYLFEFHEGFPLKGLGKGRRPISYTALPPPGTQVLAGNVVRCAVLPTADDGRERHSGELVRIGCPRPHPSGVRQGGVGTLRKDMMRAKVVNTANQKSVRSAAVAFAPPRVSH